MDVMIRIGILVPFTMLIIKRTLAGELIGIGTVQSRRLASSVELHE